MGVNEDLTIETLNTLCKILQYSNAMSLSNLPERLRC